jgi:peptide chain release factor 1
VLPIDKLEQLARRYADLDELMCKPDVLANAKELNRLNRERTDLGPLITAYGVYKTKSGELAQAKELVGDADFAEMARAEIGQLEPALKELEEQIQVLLLPRDPNDAKNTILEIRSGEGGEEAALFAADLFRMYGRYAETRGWKIEVLSTSEASAGGIKEVIALVSGKDVYSNLRFEGGVHRVQRVPQTETQGRIHTSTATVAVLPEADDVDVHIDDKDLEFSIAASGGPGGQGVNTTNSAVQILHKPSGIIVKCQDERSQLKNKAKALKVLKSRLLDIEREKQEAAQSAERRGMVGTGERSQKIRTYNYPQNRVSDHRIRLTLNKLERIVNGDLEELITALRTHRQAELLEATLGIKRDVASHGSAEDDD